MAINNLTFLEQCKDFIERKLQNDENSQEYKEDQKKYEAYVNSNFYSLNYFKSLQLFEPIHAKVINEVALILNAEFFLLYESKKSSQQMGNLVLFRKKEMDVGVRREIDEYYNYKEYVVSKVLISNTNIDASITTEYKSTGIEEMNCVEIIKKPKVLFPFLVADFTIDCGHYYLITVDFQTEKITIYDDRQVTYEDWSGYERQLALIHKWISNLYDTKQKSYERFDHSFNQIDSHAGNFNCGVSVMVSCIYIMLDMKFELRKEDMNKWRTKIAFLITRFGTNLPENVNISIDLIENVNILIDLTI